MWANNLLDRNRRTRGKSKRNKRIYPDTRKPHAKKRLPGGLATDLEGVPVAVGVFEVLRRADAFKAAARHDG